eukprot:TRINITY_DN5138_c0_g1_i3.p1 TRINITY_DN5138_c0_g1~~TRINITY_DN5138_c0_g1_i3.p1  ORF type:complete len:289 (-),score=60.82 TRINITY_DN5138_c0_g1_i3:87-953(-)
MMFHYSFNLPSQTGKDFSGVVTSVGSSCNRIKVGDRVFGLLPIVVGNALAEYVVTEEELLCVIPPDVKISFDEAAALPLAVLTSYQALHDYAQLKKGEKVFVNGGSSGTGCFAVQLAVAHGCPVTATCSTKNVDFVKSLGAEEVIDYTQSNWAEVLKGKDFDVFVDCVGDSWKDAQGILRQKGSKFLAIALENVDELEKMNASMAASFVANTVNNKFWSIFGYTSYLPVIVKPNVTQLQTILNLYKESKLVVPIDTVYKFEEFVEAFEKSMSRRARGKIIIKVSEPSS